MRDSSATTLIVSAMIAASGSSNHAIPTGAVQPPKAYSMEPSVKTTLRLMIARITMTDTAPVVRG